MKTQRGFTLIELIIAITLMGLLIASALPSAGTWIRNTRIRTAAESMSNGLQQARNEAVRRNRPVSFSLVAEPGGSAVSMTDLCALSSGSSGWVVSLASPAGKCTTDRDTFIAMRPPGDTAVGLSVAARDKDDAPATTVTFNGFGQVSGAAISCIKVRNPSDAATRGLNIAVNAGGQVRMCDPAVAASDPRVCPDPPAGITACQI